MRELVERQVQEILAPLIEADGGAIELVDVSPEVVVLRLLGACVGCPGVHFTTAHVVEPTLRALLGDSVRIEIERAPSR